MSEDRFHSLSDSPRGMSDVSRRAFLHHSGLIAGGIAASSLLAACGSSSPATAPASSGGATAAVKPTTGGATAAGGATVTGSATVAGSAASGTPKLGGAVVWAQELDPVSLDPHKTSNFSALQAFEHFYESLTMYDEKLTVIPGLAESWQNPDEKTYLFKLRPGVKFHDGSDFTADDVKYSLERLFDQATAAPFKSWFDAITSIETPDKQTVKMNLKAPFAPLVANFAAMRGSAIIPKDAATKSNLQLQAIGTGPFVLKEYMPESHFTLSKNKNYWDKGLPYLDDVTFKVLVDEDARVAGLRSGQIQYAYVSTEGAQRLTSEKSITVNQGKKAWLVAHFMNTFRKPFDDVRVRQAISLAVNRQEVIDKAVGGAGTLSGPMPTGHGDWFIPPEKLPYKQDLAKAKELLAQAGFPNGFKTTITCSPQYPEFVSASVVLQQQLKQVGIDAEVIQMEWGNFSKDTSKAGGWKYDIKITAMTFYPDPDGYLYNSWHTDSNSNYTYSNRKFDDIVTQARSTLDSPKRHDLYNQAQQILLDESPAIFWYVGNNIEALNNANKGYVQSYTGRRIFLKKTWLDK